MNRKEFIEKLRSELSKLPKGEVDSVIEYYEEYFDEAGPENEQEIINSLGNPRRIAAQIRSEYAVKMMDADEMPTAKKGLSAIWWVIIGIVSAPISIPLAFGLLCLVIGGACVMISIIIGVFAGIIACTVGAGACVVVGVLSLPVAISTAIMFIGIGLAGLALMAVISVAVVIGIRAMIRAMIRSIKKRNERKRAEKMGISYDTYTTSASSTKSSDSVNPAASKDKWTYKETPQNIKAAFETGEEEKKEEKKDE